jgi:uncharacterized Zn finger protein
MKKTENDPYIPLSEKLAKAQELLAKTRNIEKAELKFMASAKYISLPTEAEEAEERSEEREEISEQNLSEQMEAADNDAEVSEDEAQLSSDSAVSEAGEDPNKKEIKENSVEPDLQQEIEDTYHRIAQKMSRDDAKDSDRKNDAEDPLGKTINITV